MLSVSPPDQFFLVLVSFHPMHKLHQEREGGGICYFTLEQCSFVVSLVWFLIFFYVKKLLEKSKCGQTERNCTASVLKFRSYFGFFSSDDWDDVISSKPQPPPTGFAQPTHPAISKFEQLWKGKRPTLCTSTQYSSSRLRLAWPGPTNSATNPSRAPEAIRVWVSHPPPSPHPLLPFLFFCLSILENQFCCEEPSMTSNTTDLLLCFFYFFSFFPSLLKTKTFIHFDMAMRQSWLESSMVFVLFFPTKKTWKTFWSYDDWVDWATPGFPVIKMNLIHSLCHLRN